MERGSWKHKLQASPARKASSWISVLSEAWDQEKGGGDDEEAVAQWGLGKAM